MNKQLNTQSNKSITDLILKAVALGAGVSTLVLNILGKSDIKTSLSLLSIGLICLSIALLPKNR